MKISAEQEDQYAAFIGIDWGEKIHDVCLKKNAQDAAGFSVMASCSLLASQERSERRIKQLYASRMQIEESFCDVKS